MRDFRRSFGPRWASWGSTNHLCAKNLVKTGANEVQEPFQEKQEIWMKNQSQNRWFLEVKNLVFWWPLRRIRRFSLFRKSTKTWSKMEAQITLTSWKIGYLAFRGRIFEIFGWFLRSPTFGRSKIHQKSDSSKISRKSQKSDPGTPNNRFFMMLR
jgi:hypothetical protein